MLCHELHEKILLQVISLAQSCQSFFHCDHLFSHHITKKLVVHTKQCGSIISIGYILWFLTAHGKKSGVYKAKKWIFSNLHCFVGTTKKLVVLRKAQHLLAQKLLEPMHVAVGPPSYVPIGRFCSSQSTADTINDMGFVPLKKVKKANDCYTLEVCSQNRRYASHTYDSVGTRDSIASGRKHNK